MNRIRYFLSHPIGVCMITLALCILGFVGYNLLPVSLLPDIPIPEIYVNVAAPGRPAGDMEKIAVSPIRQKLLTLEGLSDISSRSTDNHGVIELRFSFDTDVNTALANVNDIVYEASSSLPSDFESPRIVKSRATDIPVEYVTMTLRDDTPLGETDPESFVNLCEVCENIVARRIEQLPEVAMVDIGGMMKKEIRVSPDMVVMRDAGISENDISAAISSNVVAPMSVRVKDGVYEYAVYLKNALVAAEDIADATLRKNGRVYRVGDFCEVTENFRKMTGFSMHQGKRSVTMRVIKKQEAKMADLKKALSETLRYFSHQYPDIEFSESRDQTKMLDYSIRTMKDNFLMSIILMFIVAFIFMGDLTTPAVTAVSMTVALIIGFLAFYVFKVSVNILSLSGLILVVGMMIDNILITSENIMRHVEKGEDFIMSCAAGTAEMAFPMLSSTLTTIVVFIPLIFMSDMAGTLFFDQALAVSIGLMTSYFVSLVLLPVLFMLCARMGLMNRQSRIQRKISSGITSWMIRAYDRGADVFYDHRKIVVIFVILTIPGCWLLFKVMPKSMLPETETREVVMRVDWESGLSVAENGKRVKELIRAVTPVSEEISASVGDAGFMSDGKASLSSNQAEIYVKAASPAMLDSCIDKINSHLSKAFPQASTTILAGENIFDRVFVTNIAPVIVKIYDDGKFDTNEFLGKIDEVRNVVANETGVRSDGPRLQEELSVEPDRNSLEFHDVSYEDVARELKNAFGESPAAYLSSSSFAPVVIKNNFKDWQSYYKEAVVMSRNGRTAIPLSYLTDYRFVNGFSEIIGDEAGIHFPLDLYPDDNPEKAAERIEATVHDHFPGLKTEIDGLVASEKESFGGLFWIFILSVFLIYFILCAQFESFVQPLVVLAEIPVDVCAALLALLVCGFSFNIMSAIGIIASCGIIVNDSILKIDAINHLIKEGVPIREAIHEAGRQRIRPIVMTTLTSVIAMVPFFFNNDLGSGLQQPLALGMIAALTVGTLVSLFIIPLLFEFLVVGREKHKAK